MTRSDRPALRWPHWLALAAMALGASLLRLWRLGANSLSGNEDYLALALQAMERTGSPLMPSGIFYPRAVPYTYVSSWLTQAFGVSEFTLRLPSALFSIVTVLLVFEVGRRYINQRVAWVAAALVTVSYWEIVMAQQARMYAMLTCCFLGVLVLLWHSEVANRKWLRPALLALIFLTCLLHQIALALIFFFAAFLLRQITRGERMRFATLLILFSIACAFTNSRIENKHYGQWDDLSAAATPIGVIEAPEKPKLRAKIDYLVEKTVPLYIRFRNDWPRTVDGIVLTLLVSGCAAFVRGMVTPGRGLFGMALGAQLILLLFHQFPLAGMVALAYGALSHLRGQKKVTQDLAILFGVMFAFALFWLAVSIYVVHSTNLYGLKQGLKWMLGYPPNFFRVFLESFPFLSLAAFAGMFGIAVRSIQRRSFRGDVFLMLGFLMTMLSLGMHPMALQRMYERYIYFMNPFFLMMAAWMLVTASEALVSCWQHRARLRAAVIATSILAVLVLSGGASFQRTWSFINQGHGKNDEIFDRWSGIYAFQPDFRSPAKWLCEHRNEGEPIAAMDILGYYAYCPYADYQLALTHKRDAEGWIGAKSVMGAKGLELLLAQEPRRPLWVVTAAVLLRDAPKEQTAPIQEMLATHAGEPVFVGEDGLSAVYRID